VAVENGSTNVLRFLSDVSGDNVVIHWGDPLDIACSLRNFDIIKSLETKIVHSNPGSIVCTAARLGYNEILRWLISKGDKHRYMSLGCWQWQCRSAAALWLEV
jgi:hypothetical protein